MEQQSHNGLPADPQSFLKPFPAKIMTGKVKERTRLFNDLNDLLIKTTCDNKLEATLKFVFKSFLSTIHRYEDRRSKYLVIRTIRDLLTKYPNEAPAVFISTIHSLSQAQRTAPVSEQADKTTSIVFEWINQLDRGAISGLKDEAKDQLVEIHINFSYSGYAASRLQTFWTEKLIIDDYITSLSRKGDDSIGSVILWSQIFSFCLKAGKAEMIEKHRKPALELVCKHVISSKTIIDSVVISRIRPILQKGSHEDFKNTILPALNRAVLRTPEASLKILPELIPLLSIDLSDYAADMGKMIGSLLHSKEEQLRQWAIDSVAALAKQCSNSSAIELLIKHMFAILNGSEGKLSVMDQKLSVISGIGMISHHAVTGSETVHEISETACENFMTSLKSESHEATLVHLACQMRLFAARLTRIPDSFVEWFAVMFSSKATTASVRSAYISCLEAALKEKNAADEETAKIMQLLSPIAQRSCTAPISQMPVVVEGLKASLFLLRACHYEPKLGDKVKAALSVLFDLPKLTFMNEKLIGGSNEDTLLALLSVMERLYIDFPSQLIEEKILQRALVLMLGHRGYEVRRKAITVSRIIISNSQSFQVDLIRSFFHVLSSLPEQQETIMMTSSNSENDATTTTAAEKSPLFFSPGLTQALREVCTVHVTSRDEVIVTAFAASHVPLLFKHCQKSWISILRILLKPEEIDKFLSTNRSKFLQFLETTNVLTVRENAIETLVRFFPEHFMPDLVSMIVRELSLPALKTVTKADYEIFCTPDGVLSDTSVIDMYREVESKNVKKESKSYSFKEQMDVKKLQEELEAKKGKEKEVPLNKKQLDAKAAQLERESEIRNRLRGVEQRFSVALQDMRALIRGNAFQTACEICNLIEATVNLLSSPLCAAKCAQIFLLMGQTVFRWESDFAPLSSSITFTTIRQLSPFPGCIDSSWTQEPLQQAIQRITSKLSKGLSSAVITNGSGYGDDQSQFSKQKHLLTAPAFSFTFPLLSSIISAPCFNEDLVKNALDIVSAHVCMRDEVPDLDIEDALLVEKIALRSPRYLPRRDIFDCLLNCMNIVPVYFEAEVISALLQVAKCCSGDEGCATPTDQEISRLLSALTEEKETLRSAALSCLNIIKSQLESSGAKKDVIHRIFVAQFDLSDMTSPIARKIWNDCNFQTDKSLCYSLLQDLLNADKALRHSVALALETLLQSYPEERETVFRRLMAMYRNNNTLSPAVLDPFGRPMKESRLDNWKPRAAVAVALTQIVGQAPESTVQLLINFFVPEALKDRNEVAQQHVLEAAIRFVDLHGSANMSPLLNALQSFLDRAPNNEENDAIRRSVIILMGTLAKHLDKKDPRVKPIVAKLIEGLSTPSQIVQEAVANCLPYLISSFKEEAPTLVKKLLKLLLESESYGERKGAAYGLAGIVKGLGILSLKQLDIMDRLMKAVQNKKSPNNREGALFAFEMLSNMLGRLFEPYIIHILPNLLLCYGDTNTKIRAAADQTAKTVMSKLSAHGVKLVLPALLHALDEEAWRTKVGSIDLLGSMSHCAPKQLSACLPSIVPKLMEVLADSHIKVQEAGIEALKQIGSVIRNPEIQAIVPVLLAALEDPSNQTSSCLQKMLNTKFVHFIDSPSLALIMPVIERAFKDRSTETRKMAAQIIGTMYSLTDQKDLAPYLPSIMPGLKASLIDPVPEVRSVSSKALGAMVRGMGEEIVEELMPWLIETLTSEVSSVDRSGAAQGMAEVIGGLGVVKMNQFMPEIIATTERSDIAPHVRDGYLMLFIYLPMVFNKEFAPHIGRIIAPVLKSLADENEFVRETALLAGQRIVSMYADSAIQLLLPELEKGLFDENWRIRLSSVQLLGDLLYKISGVSGKMTTETSHEDDNFGTEQSTQVITHILGAERRNRVLSGLYMGRSDVSLSVRQSSLHVWKVVVTNTPRTLKEILPTLFGLILGCLASNCDDKQQVAARTLGDLVRKLGERVLPEMIPILEKGLKSDRPDQRQGVCIGLSEIIASTSRDTIQAFADSLVPTVTRALYDPLPEVRVAAAKTFESLHSAVGSKILDEILPKLLDLLGDPVHGENTLDGLRQIMAIKGKVVLPYLVPQLTAPPVNTRALSLLSTVAGDALSKHLTKILPALLGSLSDSLDTDDEKRELEYCQSVIQAVSEDTGIRTIIDYLMDGTRSENVNVKRAAVMLILAYSQSSKGKESKSPITPYVSQLLRGLIFLFNDTSESVLQISWEALNSITKSLDSKDQIALVNDVKSAVRYAATDRRPGAKGRSIALLPGFCLSKGITPILPIYREAILNGSPDSKEAAAEGLSEVIRLTSAEALKPSVVNIAGPLIRILGDRYASSVKVAVLSTLTLLLEKVGSNLRPFLPQLQQTFLKALADSNKQVRCKAAHALSHLVRVHSKCDPLFQEIMNLVRGDDSAVRETALFALRVSLLPAGDKISDTVSKSITQTIISLLGSGGPEDTIRVHAAACLGTICKWLSAEEFAIVAKSHLLREDTTSDWILSHGCSVALRICLKVSPERIASNEWRDALEKSLSRYISSDRAPLVINGVKGTAYYLKYAIESDSTLAPTLVSGFARAMNHSSNEVKQSAAASSIYLSKNMEKRLPINLMKSLVPLLVNGTKEKNTMVKANSEHALVSVLRLREEEDDTTAVLLAQLDPGPREALQDCIHKVLKRTLSQPEAKEEEFDDTLNL